MKDTKSLIIRSAVKITIAIALLLIVSIVTDAFAPHMSNELAIGQLENDDMSWSLMQTWYKVQNYIDIVRIAIFAWCGTTIGIDIYKYFKTKGENQV